MNTENPMLSRKAHDAHMGAGQDCDWCLAYPDLDDLEIIDGLQMCRACRIAEGVEDPEE